MRRKEELKRSCDEALAYEHRVALHRIEETKEKLRYAASLIQQAMNADDEWRERLRIIENEMRKRRTLD